MPITLNPMQELMIREAIATGEFATPEAAVEKALDDFFEEGWDFGDPEVIEARLKESIGQYERGEFYTPEESMALLEEHKKQCAPGPALNLFRASKIQKRTLPG